MCKNVICCNIDVPSIITSINQIDNFKIIDQYWGDGNASERIAKYVKEYTNNYALIEDRGEALEDAILKAYNEAE